MEHDTSVLARLLNMTPEEFAAAVRRSEVEQALDVERQAGRLVNEAGGNVIAAYLAGKCANGAQRDGGRVIHLIVNSEMPWGRAACGARPGVRRGNGWAPAAPGVQPTCPRCLRK